MENGSERIEGTVEEIIFQNEVNGYTVCLVDVGGEPVTAVGIIPYLAEGEVLRASGSWQVHPSFGRQFKVESFEKQLPEDEDAVFRYLSSGAIKGIGPVTAKRIVDKFGKDTLSVLENHSEWLSDIRGITPARAKEIGEAFISQYGARETMIFLSKYFGSAISVRIYKKYKSAAPDIIKANPYRLCDDIAGIGFLKADKVAFDLGFTEESPERVQAGVKYALLHSAYQEGHCFLPSDLFLQKCMSMLGVNDIVVATATAYCLNRGEIVKTEYAGKSGYALVSIHKSEEYVAKKLELLSMNRLPFPVEGINEQIKLSEKKQKIEYDGKQVDAINRAVSSGISVVTGGPGTGKTTVIKAIIDIFESLGIKYMLAAPTGRAAKRMSEASGREAKTIHRMLEAVNTSDGSPSFAHNEDNPLPALMYIIDEVSMVDIFLMEALLRAVKPDAMFVFIGDADQLPSVGPGNVLGDITESGKFFVTRLEHIFRQAEMSQIIVNAHKINNGEMPDITRRDGDFFFMERGDIKDAQSLIASLCSERLPNAYKFHPLDDIQVITPTKRGEGGTRELNRVLQEVLNPPTRMKKERHIGDTVFREGDKVMQIRNNYDLVWTKDYEDGSGIFNGDIGRIISINVHEENFTIDFGGRICEYDFVLADDLELAYAITVHKSQGSEYPAVILPLIMCPPPLMTRNLLYTAVTRAKTILICVGSPNIMQRMIANDKKDERFTALPYMFEEDKKTEDTNQ